MIKVKVKYLTDHGDKKKGSTAIMPLHEARRLRWAGVIEEKGRAPETKDG